MISGSDKIEVKDDRAYGAMLNNSIAVADRMEPTIQESKGEISQHSQQRPVKAAKPYSSADAAFCTPLEEMVRFGYFSCFPCGLLLQEPVLVDPQ